MDLQVALSQGVQRPLDACMSQHAPCEICVTVHRTHTHTYIRVQECMSMPEPGSSMWSTCCSISFTVNMDWCVSLTIDIRLSACVGGRSMGVGAAPHIA